MRDRLPIDNPGVSSEWDYELNVPFLPDEFTGGSEQRVWWKCKKCGHRWQAKIYSRTAGSGCPVCTVNAELNLYENAEQILYICGDK